MDLGISNKTALLTGAGGTMGLAITEQLIEDGVKVIATDISEEHLAEVEKKFGQQVRIIHADLSSAENIDDLYSQSGPVDILIHAAGITGDKGDPLDLPESAWQTALQVDLMSAVRLSKRYIPDMAERNWGRVVFVTSENATQSYPDEVVYNVAKVGTVSFAKAVSMAYAEKGVLVNCVSPAFIATNMTDQMMEQRSEKLNVSFDEAVKSFLDEERPYLVLKRRGHAEEVSGVVAFLVSQKASFVTGSNYRVDGGSVVSLDL